MVEAALKAKLDAFPKLTNKDSKRLYDLSDILCEIESMKQDPKYRTLLGYFDSSSGVRPIVSKLPYNIQEKWTTHAAIYKRRHNVPFPPFHVFTDFIKELSQIKNDPSFACEYNGPATPNTSSMRNTGKPAQTANPSRTNCTTKKTDVASNEHNNNVSKCPLHKTNHSLNQCRGFRNLPLEDRKNFLKERGICFRCCSPGHISRNCTETIACSECGSDRHSSALHINKSDTSTSSKPATADGGECVTTTAVQMKCTKICNPGFNGRSCSKTTLAKVYHRDNPNHVITAYVILDDQSNVSLAKSTFFELFGDRSKDIPYNLSSCSGYTRTAGRRASGYVIESMDSTNRLQIPTIIECDEIPNVREEIATPEIASYYTHLQDIAKHIPPMDSEAQILLLIGRDVPEAHHVLEQITGPQNSPFAQRLKLGWVIIGETCLGKTHKPDATVNKIFIHADGRPSLFPPCHSKFHVQQNCEVSNPVDEDTSSVLFKTTRRDNEKGLSVEDQKFLQLMDKEMFQLPEGNWVAPLPFKSPRMRLQNNRSQAVKRAHSLHNSLKHNATKKKHFVEFMAKLFQSNHAELAPPLAEHEECWYLPLFGVYHPQKPDQIRGVFDSSAQFEGVSLNDVLLKGPDMTNNLLGVLMRFRTVQTAVTADIQSMFHCFMVKEDHRNFLRFLWYADNDPERELVEYRMKVHVFGNKPSPAIATYGLRKAAQMTEDQFGKDVVEAVTRNFYVDDGLLSRPTVDMTIDLLKRTQGALLTGGNLRLHKIASNNPEVIKAFPQEDHAKHIQNLNLDEDDLLLQRSLGLMWNLQSDAFTFTVSRQEKAYTRRGVLSTIASLYDPVGFAAPIMIQGKILLRELMSETINWDEPLSPNMEREWDDWKDSLTRLEQLSISRPYSPFSPLSSSTEEISIFSDASEQAIAAAAYMTTTSPEGDSHTSFVIGKAKVAPTHGHTIPRLELCGAVLAVEIGEMISDHLDIPLGSIKYFTDSKVVLGYLHNETRRFYVYVANRVARIRKSSDPNQWKYVHTNQNPADVATRGRTTANPDLLVNAWLQGPEQHVIKEDPANHNFDLTDSDSDKEVRPKFTNVNECHSLGSQRFSKFSSWKRLVEAIATLQHIILTMKGETTCKGWHTCPQTRSVGSFEKAKILVVKEVQHEAYGQEIQCLIANEALPKGSPILSLDPKLDENGLLRVGGRLRQAKINLEGKHPIIIPGKHHIATLLIRHHHEAVSHQGRLVTEGAVRSAGWWITGAKRLINSILHKCVSCRKQRRPPAHQKMADLPPDRVTPTPPFTYVGVDTFGPWDIVTRRTRGGSANNKRWAILFTCLTTRAIHIEIFEEMSSSAFINALRRFQSIRGKVTQYRSDRGTNFVGATDDLKIDTVNVEDSPVKSFLYNSGVTWHFNPPHSSHMGGSWERMIGITRRILDSMMADILQELDTRGVNNLHVRSLRHRQQPPYCSCVNRPRVTFYSNTQHVTYRQD